MSEPTSPPTGDIHMCMAAIMRGVSAIEKNQRNEQQRFNFRGIDDVMNALHPIFSAHGVVCVPFAEKIETRVFPKGEAGKFLFQTIVTIVYRFTAADGSFLEAKIFGEGCDSADKSTAKALSAAYKAVMLQIFAIPTADLEDADLHPPTIMPREELQRRAEARDRAAMTEIMEQHLSDAQLAENEAEKKRLQGLASEMRCKIADLDATPADAAAAPESGATEPSPERGKAEHTAKIGWREIVVHTGQKLKGKTLAELFDREDLKACQDLMGWWMQRGGYMERVSGQIQGHKEKKHGPPMEEDLALYNGIKQAAEYLDERASKEGK